MGNKDNTGSCHKPVLIVEVLQWLIHGEPKTILDCTVGYGGHSEIILDSSDSVMKLIGLDQDIRAINSSRERLERFGERVVLRKGNFRDLKRHLIEMGVPSVAGVLFDLGVSSPQLDDPVRGFSFMQDGPLDMRMDQATDVTAADLVNGRTEQELADIMYQYGEERYSRRIARAIVREREHGSIDTTGALTSLVVGAVPFAYRHGRIHCATRTFQALRIAVNRELERLEPSLRAAVEVLAPKGRICVISFHSLEDRIVKHTFRSLAQGPAGCLALLT